MNLKVEKNPERFAKGLENRVNVSKSYNHFLWELARQNKLKKLFENGQVRLTEHLDIITQSDLSDYSSNTLRKEKVLSDEFKNTINSKSNQSRFKLKGGELNMETHESLDLDTKDLPENEALNGEIVEIHTGRRDEINENFDPSESPEWAKADDEMVQVVIEVDYRGESLTHSETIAYYDNPDPRSDLGAWIRRYDSPEVGQQVNVDYDSDGRGSVVLPN